MMMSESKVVDGELGSVVTLVLETLDSGGTLYWLLNLFITHHIRGDTGLWSRPGGGGHPAL